ncbi:MAG: PfkB family carbohydrate kinase, partial [Ginsengibacter sp.]
KPNLHEVFTSLNLIADHVSVEMLSGIHDQLKEHLDHNISMITLSEKGIFYQEENDKNIIPSHRRNIADVSGAGDTVIAVASLVYASTKNIQLAAEVANIAGGIVCEEVGTAAINMEKLMEECKALIS